MHLFSVQFPFPPPVCLNFPSSPLRKKTIRSLRQKLAKHSPWCLEDRAEDRLHARHILNACRGAFVRLSVCLYAWNFSLMRLCRWERGRGNRSCVPPNPPCWYSSGRLIRQRTLCTKGRFALRAFHVLQTHNSRCKIKHPLCSVPHPLRGWELNVVIAQQSLPLRLTTGGKLPDNYIPQGFIG